VPAEQLIDVVRTFVLELPPSREARTETSRAAA
jgi:hypothetical protein